MADNLVEEESASYEGLLQRHKKEKKDLIGKIQSLKHSVPKGDKKKKKEITLEIAKLEAELEERHKKEINEYNNDNKTEKLDDITQKLEEAKVSNTSEESGTKSSRAAKRRAKKAAEEQERERRIAEAEVENVNCARNVEIEQMKQILKERNLEIHEITPDGHCLYNAVAHQLRRKNIQFQYEQLRQQAGNYMLSHSEDFIPFLIHSETGELYTQDEFMKYCKDVATTSVWGGQLELQALSHVLQMPIEVIQASAAAIKIGEEFNHSSSPLLLSYHHHAYGLGEHYNSLIPKTEEDL